MQNLIKYLKSLHAMKITIDDSGKSVEGLKDSMHSNIGIERSMNQAIRFVEEDFATHIDITKRMSSSIIKIFEKSKVVEGEIDFDN